MNTSRDTSVLPMKLSSLIKGFSSVALVTVDIQLYSPIADTKQGLDITWTLAVEARQELDTVWTLASTTSHLSCSTRRLSCSMAANIPVQKTLLSQWLSPCTNPWEYHQRRETYDKYKFNAASFWVLYSFRQGMYNVLLICTKTLYSLYWWAHLYFCHSGFSSYKKSPRLEWTSSGREHSFLQKKI